MISIRVNPLFIIVIILFSVLGLFWEVVIAFSLVFFHELVHSLAAYKLGYKILKIEIFPFGGVAEYLGLVEMEPLNEIKIAVAGPLFNIITAAVFFILPFSNYYIDLIINYNLIIGLFNLLPALPLDGGRIIRGIFVSRLGFQRGTKLSVKLAKLFAFIGAGLGIITVIYNKSNVWILLVSFFVYGAVIKEDKKTIYNLLSYLTKRREYQAEASLRPVSHRVVKQGVILREVISYIIPGKYNIFYVLNESHELVATITETRLIDCFFSVEDKELKIGDII